MAVTIIPVDSSNRAEAEQLQVHESQIHFIESVKECMEEADQLDLWHPVAIYDGDTMVGFSMYGFYVEEDGSGRLWFDRLLIDKRFQGHGYGRQAISVCLHRMRREYPLQDIYLSVYDPNKNAIALYESCGFHFNGELDTNGERIMVLPKEAPLP